MTDVKLICLTFVHLVVELLVSCRRIHVGQFACSRFDLSSILRLARFESSFFLLRSFVPQRQIDERFCYHLTTVASCEEPNFLVWPARAAPDPKPKLGEPLHPSRRLKIQNYHFFVGLVASNPVTKNANFKIKLPQNHYPPRSLKKFGFKPVSHQRTTKLDSTHFGRL